MCAASMSGTLSTGDRHEGEIPDHVHSTTGQELTPPVPPATPTA
jgi:hypothetical protein